MKNLLNQIIAHRLGVFALLMTAAFLEAYADSLFQTGVHRSSGPVRIFSLLCGAALLTLYGFTVNLPNWDFGELIGLYVVFFFLAAQFLARVRFHQTPSTAIYAGGSLIVAGGAIIAFWRR